MVILFSVGIKKVLVDDVGRTRDGTDGHEKAYLVSLPIRTVNNELVAKLLEFGRDLEVLEPQSLRDKMQEQAESMTALYRDRT